MQVVKKKQRQYVFKYSSYNGIKFVFLSTKPPRTDDHECAIIYNVNDNTFWFYTGFGNDSQQLYNEFNVLSIYKENFEYREENYWRFIKLVEVCRKGYKHDESEN